MADRDEELGIDFTPALSAIDALDARVDDLINKVADGLGGAFGSALGALDAPIKLDVDTTEVDAAVSDIEALGTQEPVVVPVLAEADSLAAAEGDIEDLIAAGQAGAEITVTVDEGELVTAGEELDELKDKAAEPIEATVTVDDSSLAEASSQIDQVGQSADSAAGSVDSLGTSGKAAAVGLGGLGAELQGVAGVNLSGAVAGAAGFAAFVAESTDLALKADAAVRRLADATGVYAQSIDALDQTGLNKDLSAFSLEIGADDDALRVFASRFFQAGEGAGVATDKVNAATQGLIEFAGQLSVANPQLGSASDFINNLSNSLARGGRALLPYGLAISAADIQQRALSDTLKTNVADLSIFDKQVAGSEIAIERYGTKFKEAFDEGLDSPLVKLRSLKQTLEEALEAAGKEGLDSFIDALAAAVPTLADVIGLLGQAGSVALPVLAQGLELVVPVLQLVLDVIDAIPAPAREGIIVFGLLAFAAEALVGKIALIAPALAESLAPLLAVSAAVAAVAFVVSKFGDSQKEAVQVSGAYAKALSDGAKAAQATVTATTSAASAQDSLTAAIKRTTQAAALDKLKPFADAFAGIGVNVEELTGIFGDNEDTIKALNALLPKLAIATGATDKSLSDLKVTSIGEAQALVAQIRGHGELTDAQNKALDGLIALNGERNIGVEQLQKLAEAGDAQAVQTLKALGFGEGFVVVLSDEEQAANDAATALAATGNAAEEADKQQQDLSESLDGTADSFGGLVDQMDKTLGLFDKLAGRPFDLAKAMIDVKDKTADFAKGLSDPASKSASLAADLHVAEQNVTKLGAQLKLGKATQADYAKATQDVAEKQKAYKDSLSGTTDKLNINSDAGRDNVKNLTDILETLRGVTEAQLKNGSSIDDVKTAYAGQIDSLRKVALAGGITGKAFDDLLKVYQATPDQIVTTLKLAGVDEAQSALEPYAALIATLPPEKQTEIRQLGAVDTQAAVDLLKKDLDELPASKVVEISVKFAQDELAKFGQFLDSISSQPGNPTSSGKRARGGIDFPMTRYDLGGIAADKRQATMVQAGANVRLFGEPDTGGEAFIPLAADSRRGRAIDLTADVAGRFGFDLVPKGAPLTAPSFDDSRMVATLAAGFGDLAAGLDAVRSTMADMEAGVNVHLESPPGQSPEAAGARAGQAFRQVARGR